MKNLFTYTYQKIIDSLTGRKKISQNGTDILVASASETPSAAGTFTLTSFTVEPGQECVIGDVDLGASGSATAEITVTYKDYTGTSITITRYLYLGAAGFVNEEHDFEDRPFFAFYNPVIQNNAVTVDYNILSAADTIQYTGNIAYVVRTPAE